MPAAKKTFTESMIRRTIQAHGPNELESNDPNKETCSCSWEGTNWEDHFIDQLHQLWHNTFSRKRSEQSSEQSIPQTQEEPQLVEAIV